MVVVAIIGVLSTMAVVTIARGPAMSETTSSIAARFRDAKRRAASMGPISEAVMFNPANAGLFERARLRITKDEVILEVIQEDPPPSVGAPYPDTYQWAELSRFELPAEYEINGYLPTAELAAGTAVFNLLAASTHEVKCFPSGACEAVTLFLHRTADSEERQRLVLLPLMGSPMVFKDW